MSAVPIRTFSAVLSRSTSPIAWEAFAGAPLSILGVLPSGQDFAGVTAVRAELHDSLTNSAAPLAVSDALTTLPTGDSVALTFSSAATNRAAGRYWVSVYATYADARLEVFRVAELQLVEGAVSQLTPQAPAPALYATSADVTAVLDRVVVLEETPPGSSLVTSVAGRQGAVTLTWSDIGGAALPLALTSAPGLTSAAGGTFGSAAFVAASSFVPVARTVNGQPLSGNVTISTITGSAGSFTGALAGDVTGTQGATVIAASTVTGMALTGYLSGAGTITAADSILTAINKLNGNDALKAPLDSPTFTGTVSGITAAMVGLGNANNTADANKPVSTAQQTALDLKANLASPTFTGTVSGITAAMVGLGNVTNTSDAAKPVSTAQQAALDLKANTAALGALATISPTGTADATTYLRGDGVYAPRLIYVTETLQTRTLLLVDRDAVINCTHATSTALTVPPYSTSLVPFGTIHAARRATGAGLITLTPGAGVTILGNTASSVAAEGMFAVVNVGLNTWIYI